MNAELMSIRYDFNVACLALRYSAILVLTFIKLVDKFEEMSGHCHSQTMISCAKSR